MGCLSGHSGGHSTRANPSGHLMLTLAITRANELSPSQTFSVQRKPRTLASIRSLFCLGSAGNEAGTEQVERQGFGVMRQGTDGGWHLNASSASTAGMSLRRQAKMLLKG